MADRTILDIHPEVMEALAGDRPVVALESTLIAHGLPWPINIQTAREAEQAVRDEGAVPATIAVWQGRPFVGIGNARLEELACSSRVLKAARRDLATAISQGKTAATTVSATMHLAHLAGIRVFATGGIGGAHPGPEAAWDVSADLLELARTPVAVVCAGAKSILDVPRTLEILETLGVPVIGYGTELFPAFYLRSSGERAPARVDSPQSAAAVLETHWALQGAGAVIALPIGEEFALSPEEFARALDVAARELSGRRIRGKEVTPFLLARLADLTGGRTLSANRALVVANARLAGRIAKALAPRKR